jgi:hypothetical protein
MLPSSAAITGTAAAHKSAAAAKPLIIIRFGMLTSSSKNRCLLMYWAPFGSTFQVVNLRFIEVAFRPSYPFVGIEIHTG